MHPTLNRENTCPKFYPLITGPKVTANTRRPHKRWLMLHK